VRKYIFIASGGALGAMLRFAIENSYICNYHGIIPLNTLLINISGSFLLGLILTVAFEVWNFDADIRLGIATGFLGAYTTFSTFCKETAKLIAGGQYYAAISYMTISTMLGLAAAYFGIILAREIIAKLVKGKREELFEEIVEESESE
jgi:CrcB protein